MFTNAGMVPFKNVFNGAETIKNKDGEGALEVAARPYYATLEIMKMLVILQTTFQIRFCEIPKTCSNFAKLLITQLYHIHSFNFVSVPFVSRLEDLGVDFMCSLIYTSTSVFTYITPSLKAHHWFPIRQQKIFKTMVLN